MVSDNLAQLQRLTLGEVLEIPAPHGIIRLPIVGIVVDYSDQQGTILMDRRVFEQYWHDDSVNAFRLYLSPNTTPAAVKRQILSRYAGVRQVFVLTNRELKDYILKITDQWFSLSSVQFVRFSLSRSQCDALRAGAPVRIASDHPAYAHATAIDAPTARTLATDLED